MENTSEEGAALRDYSVLTDLVDHYAAAMRCNLRMTEYTQSCNLFNDAYGVTENGV
jgi:UDP-glucose 4-epimerase